MNTEATLNDKGETMRSSQHNSRRVLAGVAAVAILFTLAFTRVGSNAAPASSPISMSGMTSFAAGIGSLAVFSNNVSQVQRPNGDTDCRAGGGIYNETARLSTLDDLTKAGVHKVLLESVSPIVISVARSWGGGRVTVPSDLVSANFMIENSPKDGNATKGGVPLTFQIIGMEAHVKSFEYPRKVITGENSFEIVRDKSFVRVYGSHGTAKLTGEAEATLTNRLFSADNPARVMITFQGRYNFATRNATLTTIDVRAKSPKPQLGVSGLLSFLAFLRLI